MNKEKDEEMKEVFKQDLKQALINEGRYTEDELEEKLNELMEQAVCRERWPIHGLLDDNLKNFKEWYSEQLHKGDPNMDPTRKQALIDEVARSVSGHLPPHIEEYIKEIEKKGIDVTVVRKRHREDAYSCWRSAGGEPLQETAKALNGNLTVSTLFAGLAFDYCVGNSARDLINILKKLYPMQMSEVTVLTNVTQYIIGKEPMRKQLTEAGVTLQTLQDFILQKAGKLSLEAAQDSVSPRTGNEARYSVAKLRREYEDRVRMMQAEASKMQRPSQTKEQGDASPHTPSPTGGKL